jgi:hypothetical protein
MSDYFKQFNIDAAASHYIGEFFHPMNAVQFENYRAGEMKLKEASAFEADLYKRLCYIVHAIHGSQHSLVHSFDFYYADRRVYYNETDYTGSFSGDGIAYENTFPTSWFHEAFENELLAEVEKNTIADMHYKAQVDVEYERLVKETANLQSMLTNDQKTLVLFKNTQMLKGQAEENIRESIRKEEARKKPTRKVKAKTSAKKRG